MEPRLSVITLGVEDLERALAFYRRLGLESSGIVGGEWRDEVTGANGAVALFELDGGLTLSLYPRGDLSRDAEALGTGGAQGGACSLGQLVRSREEVDELLVRAEAAGASVTGGRERPWGIYSGYFRDPDGHLWEIVWNPGRPPDPTA